MGYFSQKCGHGVELCSLLRNSTKLYSSFLFTGTASEFNNAKAWKMTDVRNKPKFRSSLKVVVIIESARMGQF